MKRELKLKKNQRIKESFYMLTARANDHKKATEEEEEVKVVFIMEAEEDAITVVVTGHKEEMHLELYVIVATRPVIMSTIVPTGCLSSKKRRRMRMIAHMKLRS